MITAFERFNEITGDDRTPSIRFAEWLEAVNRQVNQATVETGTGSPEGVVTAGPTQLYMDDAGTAGSILYIKKTGTGKTGWVLI